MGALWEGPGSAKVRQGSIFDGKTGLILRFSFFALNDFWKSPRGSRERAAEQQEFQRGAQGGAPSSLWGPKGGFPAKRGPLRRARSAGPAERGGPGGGGGGFASRRRRNRLLPKDAQYPLGTADLKWLPPHSADPLPEFQFRDCGFVVSGTGFQNFRLRSVGISIFPALELPDFKISSFGASRFQYFRFRIARPL